MNIKSRLSPIKATLCLFIGVILILSHSLSALAKDSVGEVFKRIKPPTSEWTVSKKKKGEVEVGVKGRTDAVNIGVRLQAGVPISVESFLDQVRTKILEDPSYQKPEVTLVNSQAVGGTNWSFFVIKRKDQINQEFWARPLSSDEILMVLYTAVGNYYPQYHEDLFKVLQQAAKD